VSDVTPSAAYTITQDDRTMGSLAHFLQIACSWIAPLVILLLKRDSLFVKFHALQALFLQICFLAVSIVGAVAFMITILATMPASGSSAQHVPPLVMIAGFGLFWVAIRGSWISVLVVAVLYGIKAGRGEWAGYPVIGRMARQLLQF